MSSGAPMYAVGLTCLVCSWCSGESPKAEMPRVIENSVGLKLVLIPAGEFVMGSPESEAGRQQDEYQHRVRITKPFYLGLHEVTQAEYERVMGTNPSCFSSDGDGREKVSGMYTSRFPVEWVSWEDAAEFCRRLSALAEERSAGRSYRLPTEAEWEYACRGRTTTPFHFGGRLNGAEANCDGNRPYGTASKGPYLGRPTTADSYQPNAFGLCDMHGNVWEWCQDWYAADYYQESPADDPPGGKQSLYRVIRGGSWDCDARSCRSADRDWRAPTYRDSILGFRVAL